jgi:hypothetical protein
MIIMNKIRPIILGWIAGAALLFASCDSWLDVKPDDRIIGEELFKERAGFSTALNGIYAALNSPYLYGGNLTAGMIDVMGQYYNITVGIQGDPSYFINYSYTMPYAKAQADSIWRHSYKLIGNCNVIIGECGEGNPVLSDDYYRLIKGEALALRAYLHFDLLRLYGPVWANKEDPAIPYMMSTDRAVQPFLTGEEVLQRVIDDLTAASALLATVDPVLTEGPRNFAGEAVAGGSDWNYRPLRLNYFAVRLLLARAYLWGDDKVNAGETARDLIERANNPEQRFFPLTAAGLQGIVNDRVFSQELLFALYNISRQQRIYNTYFYSGLPIAKIFGLTGNTSAGRASFMFDDANDYRFKMLVPRVIDATELTVSMKYEDVILDTERGVEPYCYLIPLMRLSEAYLIAAECEEDVQVALDKYINPLRLARNSRNLTASTPAELTSLIFAEYTREFIGEGQLFFYFKRRALLSIPNGTRPNTMQTKTIAIYAFPVPDSETYPRAE